jgi:uncharacterized protein YdbL (DUF1318 family)
MKTLKFFIGLALILGVGCATVKLQAPKEPIKVDVTMRLDVYQHVQNDIDAIESIVTGPSTGANQPAGPISLLDCMESTAYAESLSPEIENAALRRKARYTGLIALERSGVVGEARTGMVVVRKTADASVEKLVREENSDRAIIYKGIAAKNGTTEQEVQKVYAERLQGSAPAGTPIETESGVWQIK